MVFTTPIWLLLLVPWGILVLWVLFARADFARVSTTQFWNVNDTSQASRRGITRPPLAIVLMLLAVLLAIFAAAGFGYRDPNRRARITVIVDRGLATTTAVSRQIDEVRSRLAGSNQSATPVDFITIPDRALVSTDLGDAAKQLGSIKPIAVDTAPALHQMVSRELSRTDQQIIVVTAQMLQLADPRVSVIAPPVTIYNAGIERFSVSDTERPKAMVRVWNGTDVKKASLRVDEIEIQIDLPLRGGWEDYFVDLPALGASVHARLIINDDIDADNDAYLVRSGAWPTIEAKSALPSGVERMIDVYSRHRAPGQDGTKVIVTSNPADASANAAAVILPPGAKPLEGRLTINMDDKLGREVQWSRAIEGARGAPVAGDGWRSIVKVGDDVLVAVRDQPARQVWVGIDSPAWAIRPDFVVFFADVFDYLGGSARSYVSEPTRPLPNEWRRTEPSDTSPVECLPGIYRTTDSALALNCPVVRPLASNEPVEGLGPIIISASEIVNLSSPLLIVCLCIMAMSAYCLTRIRSRLG